MSKKEWLRANTTGRPRGVDKELKTIFGAILAEEGPFKSEDRGEFSAKSIKKVTQLARKARGGLRVRFGHPNLSAEGLGTMLGRMHSITTETIEKEIRGEKRNVLASRGDILFNDSAFHTPNGDLATYVMDLVDEDDVGDNAGMSLVLTTDQEIRTDSKGKRLLDDDGIELPPIWHPTALMAVDVVDEGDATSSMLAAAGIEVDGLRDEVLRKAEELLQKQFAGKDRAFVESHLTAWVYRALDAYWPVDDGLDSCWPNDGHRATFGTADDADILRRRLALKLR